MHDTLDYPFAPKYAPELLELLLTRLVLLDPETSGDRFWTAQPPTLGELWDIVKWWANVPTELSGDDDRDLLLYELTASMDPYIGEDTLWFEARPHVQLGITRQLIPVAPGGEDGDMENVWLRLHFEPEQELLREMGDHVAENQLWGAAGPNSTSWAQRVEQSALFRTLLTREPYAFAIDAGHV